LVTSIFQAISAGTFLYIAAFEVLHEKINNSRFRELKYRVYLIAIGFALSLCFVEQELVR
jgi:zinc transporter 1/2/3